MMTCDKEEANSEFLIENLYMWKTCGKAQITADDSAKGKINIDSDQDSASCRRKPKNHAWC